jgi:hypothetical protein
MVRDVLVKSKWGTNQYQTPTKQGNARQNNTEAMQPKAVAISAATEISLSSSLHHAHLI